MDDDIIIKEKKIKRLNFLVNFCFLIIIVMIVLLLSIVV